MSKKQSKAQEEEVKLVYVSDAQKGIRREKADEGFIYRYNGRKLTAKKELERIRRLAIPPAWTNVWICADPNGHIQAVGFDAKNRKQYRYHKAWSELRNQDKFDKLASFGKKLPQLRCKIEKDLSLKELCLEKVLAVIISVMERTYIRIGNNGYEKLYGSYGLTTLKDQHVKVEGNNISFSFKGKKGIHHRIKMNNRRLARMIKQCREIPGKELFQYYDQHNEAHPVHSGHVNSYIKEATGEDYTAKDFRTWAGSVHAIDYLLKLGEAETSKGCSENIIQALEYVSGKLGNTRTVCKKYYVHPAIFEQYESRKLFNHCNTQDKVDYLTNEELVLLAMLAGM